MVKSSTILSTNMPKEGHVPGVFGISVGSVEFYGICGVSMGSVESLCGLWDLWGLSGVYGVSLGSVGYYGICVVPVGLWGLCGVCPGVQSLLNPQVLSEPRPSP